LLEVAMTLVPCLLALALAGDPVSPRPPCDTARLVKIRTVERVEGRAGGPVPPKEEGAAPGPSAPSTALYDLTLECDGKAYVARVAGGTPGFRPDELEAAVTLHLRVEKGKVFLRREGGKEFEARLATLPSGKGSPPK
jgi:hypothetical protein